MDAPWISRKQLAIGDKNGRLHKEILGFEKYITPTANEITARSKLVGDIEDIVNCLYPEQYKTVTFGSVESGLLFPSSDVDINIEPIESTIPVNVKGVLRSIHKRGMRDRIFFYQDTTLVLHARVPILTIQRRSGVSADISIANDICSSDRTVVWVRQYPELRPMFMVLKQAISNCRLTSNPAFEPLSAKTCGLASYGLICLIVNYLEHENRRVINQEHYFATLLMGFLRFYGQFDETTKAISMQNGGHYYAIGESDLPVEFDGKPGQLVVVDPDKDVNVARSCIKFDQVKLIMNHLAELVEKRMRTADAEESILSSIIKINGHYHEEPRREGSDFISENILIDNGRPVVKARFMDKFNPKKSNHMRGEKRGYNNYEEHNNNNGSNYKGNRTNNATRRHNPYARQPDQYNGSKKRSFNANNQNNRNNSQYNNNDNNRYNSNNSNDRRKRFY